MIQQNNMLDYILIYDVSLKCQKMTCGVNEQTLFALNSLASNQTNPVYTLHQPFCHLAFLPR